MSDIQTDIMVLWYTVCRPVKKIKTSSTEMSDMFELM